MNRTFIGLIGAAVLGALTACSGQNGEWDTELDTTSQNVVSGIPALGTGVGGPFERSFAASCQLGTDTIVAGGYDAAGDATVDTFLFDGTSWTKLDDLPGPLAEAQGIAIGADECIIAGGKTTIGGNSVNTTYRLDLSAGTQWFATSNMNDTRVNHELRACGTSKVIAFNGRDSGNNMLATVEVYDPSIPSWARLDVVPGSATSDLAVGREYPAVVANGTTQFIIAAGNDATTALQRVEALKVDNTCAVLSSMGNIGYAANLVNLAARTQQFSLLKAVSGSNVTALIGGGKSGTGASSALTSSENVVVSFAATTPTLVSNAADDVMTTGRRLAKAVPFNGTRFAIVGGLAAPSGISVADPSVGNVEIYDPASSQFENIAGTNGSVEALTDARYGYALESDGTNAIVVGGIKVLPTGAVSVLSSGEVIAP